MALTGPTRAFVGSSPVGEFVALVEHAIEKKAMLQELYKAAGGCERWLAAVRLQSGRAISRSPRRSALSAVPWVRGATDGAGAARGEGDGQKA